MVRIPTRAPFTHFYCLFLNINVFRGARYQIFNSRPNENLSRVKSNVNFNWDDYSRNTTNINLNPELFISLNALVY